MSMLSRLPFHGGIPYSDITVVTSGTGVGDVTTTLSTSIQQNDVIFLNIGYDETDWSVPAGYVQYTGGVLTGGYAYACYYKVMGATPDTTIILGDGNNSSGYTYYVLRGVQTQSPVVEVANIIGTTTAALNPPSVPVFAKCMVLTAAFAGNGTSAVITAGPSGYSGFLGVDVQALADIYVGSAYKLITSNGTEDPGAFSLTNTAAAYAATSVVIRPYSPSFVAKPPEFVASASTTNSVSQTTIVVDKPTGTVENDLMIAIMGAGTTGSSYSWTGDTGWTEVCDQATGTNLRIAYKVATASEPASYTFTLNTNVSSKGASILTYRYAAYDTIAGTFTTAANPLLLTTISPTQSQSILLAVGARAAASVTLGTPAGMTARVTDNDATAPSYIVCEQPTPKGPTGTRSISTGSTTNVAGIMLSITPTRS